MPIDYGQQRTVNVRAVEGRVVFEIDGSGVAMDEARALDLVSGIMLAIGQVTGHLYHVILAAETQPADVRDQIPGQPPQGPAGGSP